MNSLLGENNMTIDLRTHDQREHGLSPSLCASAPAVFDLALAQRIREQMRAQGMRIPLTDAEEFAEADRRLRGM